MSLIFDYPFVMPPSGVDPRDFRAAMAAMPSPVAVITTCGPAGSPAGATLSAVSSLSLAPPLFLACFDHRSETLGAIRGARRYLVHILAAGQQDVAAKFASKAADKFAGLAWRSTEEGLPHLEGCSIVMTCRLFSMLPGGDHTIVVGEVEQVLEISARPAMVYADRRMTQPATEQAPT